MEIYLVSPRRSHVFQIVLSLANRNDQHSTTRTKRGQLLSGGLNVATATEFDSKRHPHRTLVAILEQYAQECRPSVGELIVLISWMLGGMRHQDIEKASRPKDKPLRFHKTFPVCPPAL